MAESNKAQNRNLITKQLDTQKWTIQGNRTAGMNKLIDGETIAVKTKTGKTINIKFDRGTVKQAST